MSVKESFRLKLLRLGPAETWIKESGAEDELLFVLVKAGVGTYSIQNTVQRLTAGSVLFVCGRSSGKLCAAPKGDCVFTTFSVLMEQLYPLFFSNEIGLLEEVLAGFRAAKVYEPNSEVARDCRVLTDIPEAQSALVQRSQLLRIVAALLAEEFKRVQSQRSGLNWGEDHMIQIFEKLPSAELLNLSVDELAAKFSCSRRHLNRLFHQHFHLSITALRMEIRLLKAVSLLRNPQSKVINVAEQCGFNHLGLFNTCFKRRFGVSPGQWRKTASMEQAHASKSNSTDAAASSLLANKLFPAGASREAGAKKDYDGTAADLVAGLVESKVPGAGNISVLAKAKPSDPAVQSRHDG